MNAEEAQSKFKKADARFKAGKHAETLLILEELRRAFPKEKNVLYAYAVCLQALGRRDQVLVAVGELRALGDPRAEKLLTDLESRTTIENVAPQNVAKTPRHRRTVQTASLLFGLAAVACLAGYFWYPRANQTTPQPVSGLAQRQDSPAPQPPNPISSPVGEATAPTSSSNPAWAKLGLPADFKGTRVGIDFSQYLNPPPFDLQKEVGRVLSEVKAGKGVPPVLDTANPYHALWQRETYQPIIDAAREAFHKHRDPITGKSGKQEETITVPENVTGKETLIVRYVTGNADGNLTWGDDEDIIYITGSTFVRPEATVVVLPGTFVLTAALQNDQRGGVMPPQMITVLEEGFESAMRAGAAGQPTALLPITNLVIDPQYNDRLSGWAVGVLMAKGKENSPIVVCSDSSSPTSYDFFTWMFDAGIADYVLMEDSVIMRVNTERTIQSRCKNDNHLTNGRGGSGYIIGNYLGFSFSESVNLLPDDRVFLYYNLFDNNISAAMSIGEPGKRSPQTLDISFNTFCRTRPMAGGYYLNFMGDSSIPELTITQNNFLDEPPEHLGAFHISNASPFDVHVVDCYVEHQTLSRIWDKNHDPKLGPNPLQGTVVFENVRSSPVPMPFKTGVQEIDAVYKGSGR